MQKSSFYVIVGGSVRGGDFCKDYKH